MVMSIAKEERRFNAESMCKVIVGNPSGFDCFFPNLRFSAGVTLHDLASE